MSVTCLLCGAALPHDTGDSIHQRLYTALLAEGRTLIDELYPKIVVPPPQGGEGLKKQRRLEARVLSLARRFWRRKPSDTRSGGQDGR